MAAKKKTMRHASALKAHRQSLAHKAQNYKVRSRLRTLISNVLKAIKDKNKEAAKASFVLAQSAWNKAGHRNIVHKNAAKNRISRLSSQLAALAKS